MTKSWERPPEPRLVVIRRDENAAGNGWVIRGLSYGEKIFVKAVLGLFLRSS